MEITKGSLTALISAFGRAYHSIHIHPKIFDDFLAKSMMTEDIYRFIGHSMAGSVDFFDPEFAAAGPDESEALAHVMKVQSTPITLSRARYTEEQLEASVAKGIAQYVILGAGMDTFAFRRPDLVKKLQVYELDQPSTQEYKRNRLHELGWELPEQLHMLPVDFSKDDLSDALARAGYDTGKPGLFSWLGVTYYLERGDVLSTLGKIAGIAAPKSRIVFDYLDRDAFDEHKVSKRVKNMLVILERAGEPMRTAFDPDELKEILENAGMKLVHDMDPAEIQNAHYADRTDGYSAFEHLHIALAEI